MKKLMIVLAAVTASMLLVCGHASAIPITPFQLNTPYGSTISQTDDLIAELDWLPGAGLAIDANAIGPVGANPFKFMYQMHLGSIIDVNGVTLSDPTLNGQYSIPSPTPYEITMTGCMWEVGSNLGGNVASFSIVPHGSNQMKIYADKYDGTAAWGFQADKTTGVGYDDGKVIMKATPISMQSVFNITDTNGNGVLDNQDVGTGSPMVLYRVDWIDTNYWTFASPPFLGEIDPEFPLYIQYQFDATLNMPPLGVETPNMYDGTATDYYTGLPDGTTPWNTADLLFKLDGNSHFAPIPEPATMLLLGSGLVGLAGFARKKRKKVS